MFGENTRNILHINRRSRNLSSERVDDPVGKFGGISVSDFDAVRLLMCADHVRAEFDGNLGSVANLNDTRQRSHHERYTEYPKGYVRIVGAFANVGVGGGSF